MYNVITSCKVISSLSNEPLPLSRAEYNVMHDGNPLLKGSDTLWSSAALSLSNPAEFTIVSIEAEKNLMRISPEIDDTMNFHQHHVAIPAPEALRLPPAAPGALIHYASKVRSLLSLCMGRNNACAHCVRACLLGNGSASRSYALARE